MKKRIVSKLLRKAAQWIKNRLRFLGKQVLPRMAQTMKKKLAEDFMHVVDAVVFAIHDTLREVVMRMLEDLFAKAIMNRIRVYEKHCYEEGRMPDWDELTEDHNPIFKDLFKDSDSSVFAA